jgi:hypothetical protein
MYCSTGVPSLVLPKALCSLDEAGGLGAEGGDHQGQSKGAERVSGLKHG